jgi:hypothetical protein
MLLLCAVLLPSAAVLPQITFREPDIIIALARNVFHVPPSQVRC